jgi:hypothetical protein
MEMPASFAAAGIERRSLTRNAAYFGLFACAPALNLLAGPPLPNRQVDLTAKRTNDVLRKPDNLTSYRHGRARTTVSEKCRKFDTFVIYANDREGWRMLIWCPPDGT